MEHHIWKNKNSLFKWNLKAKMVRIYEHAYEIPI